MNDRVPPHEVAVPGLDALAARRWLSQRRTTSPWLHEEVASRMMERLQWFREPPASWMHWEPALGGLQAHRQLVQRLPQAQVFLFPQAQPEPTDRGAVSRLWQGLFGARRETNAGPDTRVQMIWSNMYLHQVARPQTQLRQWQDRIGTGGFLMFSCLGPDSLRELRAVYAAQHWPVAAHDFTDMHDWGDMLVQAGFAEPVMDMERLTLTYSSAAALIDELRGLGRNLSSNRFAALRGRRWRAQLEQAIERDGARDGQGRLQLTFEIIYGHAFKSLPRASRTGEQSVPLDDMRAMLRQRRP